MAETSGAKKKMGDINKFKNLLKSCGLSVSEAAYVLDRHPSDVKRWSAGIREAPDKIIRTLENIFLEIEKTAQGNKKAKQDILEKGVERRKLEISICNNPPE